MNKLDVFRKLDKQVNENDIIITPLGYTTREWYYFGDKPQNFYFTGAMGMPISFAFGLSLSTEKNVICVEGDGSCLMNLGALSTIGNYLPNNLKIIILDNEAHMSTGGQPTATSGNTRLESIAKSCGFINTRLIDSEEELDKAIHYIRNDNSCFMVIKIDQSKQDVPRMNLSPEEVKTRFEKFLKTS